MATVRLALLLFLAPLSLSLALAVPFLAVLSFTPILGILPLSLLLPTTLVLVYSISSILQLLLAPQTPISLSLSLPRKLKITGHFLRLLRDTLKARLVESALDYWVQRLVSLSLREKRSYTSIIYNSNSSNSTTTSRSLDIYLPPPIHHPTNDSRTSESGTGSIGLPVQQVVVYLGGGGYRFWSKRAGAQLGRRWAKRGYVVVVPDIVQYSEGTGVTIDDMVNDFRDVLEFVGENIERLADGDPSKIYILGWGAGTHISLLTIIQEAIVRSRESLAHSRMNPVVPGIARLRIDSEARIPSIAGMILISTICDLSVQLAREAKLGIQDLSVLKRLTPKSHQACPSRLLFASKNILDPSRLPRKFLFVGGGANSDVGISQSVLMRNLLVGIGGEELHEGQEERGDEGGEEVRGKKGSTFSNYRQSNPPLSPSPSSFNLVNPQLGSNVVGGGSRGVEARVLMFKEMNHLQSLVALMRESKYSDLIAKEVEGFVWGN